MTKEEKMEEILILFSKICKNQSPQSFSDWCGCSVEDACHIFSTSLVCKMCLEDASNKNHS